MWSSNSKRFNEAFGLYKKEIVNIRTKESVGLSDDLDSIAKVQDNHGPNVPVIIAEREDKYKKRAERLTEKFLLKTEEIIFSSVDHIKSKELSQIKKFIIEIFGGEIESIVQREEAISKALSGKYNAGIVLGKIKLNYTMKKEDFLRELELRAAKLNLLRKNERQKETKTQFKNRMWDIVKMLLAGISGYLLRYFLEKK